MHAKRLVTPELTHSDFLSTASVAAILTGVVLLAILSALILAPFDRHGRRRYVVAFWICVMAIWVGAVCILVLIRRTI